MIICNCERQFNCCHLSATLYKVAFHSHQLFSFSCSVLPNETRNNVISYYPKLDHWIIQFESFHWLSHHGHGPIDNSASARALLELLLSIEVRTVEATILHACLKTSLLFPHFPPRFYREVCFLFCIGFCIKSRKITFNGSLCY